VTRFPRVRDVLNKFKHTGRLDGTVVLVVRDRVLGEREVRGDRIVRVGRREFDVLWDQWEPASGTSNNATIPYYKVTAILKDGERIWVRPS